MNLDPESTRDADVRIATFDWLRRTVEEQGDVLPREILAQGFDFRGERVPLLGPQGIFRPRVLPRMPLSITTAPAGPYDDGFEGGRLAYRYRGTDPQHRDNVGLREAMRLQAPLVYFAGLVPGRYLATWPVFVVGDDPGALTFRVAVDDAALAQQAARDAADRSHTTTDDAGPRRAYITTTARKRLHQRAFRERVLEAYRAECGLCHLRQRVLLEAAHIIPDGEPGGEPVVRNGIALCTLHHAAFDRLLLGIRPDYGVEVRTAILHEHDGPMLQHGLKGLQGTTLMVPRDPGSRPDPSALSWRWDRYRSVA